MSLLHLLLTFTSGGLGAYARFRTDTALKQKLTLPLSTFTINTVGSFLLGLAFTCFVNREFAYLIAAGFCGGFTTFSTAMVEVVKEGRGRRPVWLVWLLLGQALCALLMVWAGMLLGNALTN